MQLGMIGLGRMGANIVRRLMRAGHSCIVYDRDPAPGLALAKEGARAVESLGALVAGLAAPRAVWIMLPAGGPTETTIEALRPLLSPGDVVIDGGNSFWRDDIRRGAALGAEGLHYVDVGVSGGVWGLERGYCLMIGGNASRSSASIRSSRRWRRAAGRFPRRRAARDATKTWRKAICTPARAAPAISSRWCTTASNTA